MATINILSRAYLNASGFSPERVKIGISGSDAALILSNPNALNIFWSTYFGVSNYIMNINSSLYYNATTPPFPNLWNITQEGSDWFVYFIVNPYTYTAFISYTSWTSFDFPYSIPPSDPNYVTVTYNDSNILPVYNPVVFKFFSPKYNETGYRYLVDVKSETNATIARLKVVPQPDGSGYIDIQRILQNSLSLDFNPNSAFTTNCANSYFKYKVSLGEEYLDNWAYTNLVESGSGNVILNQVNTSLTHNYIVGDQITIDTLSTGTTSNVYGLHEVVNVPNNYQIEIDVEYPNNDPSIPIGGTTSFSDSRKTGYSDLTVIDGKSVFNGVFDWAEWRDWNSNDYYIQGLSSSPRLLTNIDSYGGSVKHLRYYMNESQEYYLNYMISASFSSVYLNVTDNLNNSSLISLSFGSNYGLVRQFKLNYDLLITNGLSSSMEWFELYLSDIDNKHYTRPYRIYIDRRCSINDTEIYFMDKLGSILSIPFQLKSKSSINVDRETYKQQKYYNSRTSLDLKTGGDTISNISSKKVYELNSNWMNDPQVDLFEVMMESPYTYIKLDNEYYKCIIEDTSTDLEKHINKVLTRKTIKVRLSLQRPLNN